MRVYYDKDVEPGLIRSRKVAILGYGNQGRAHAHNLADSGVRVSVAVRSDSTRRQVEEAGLSVLPAAEAVKWADVVMVLIPDELQLAVWRESIAPFLSEGKYLAFAHGFNVHFGQIAPPPGVNVFMVAPKSPGSLVREQYLAGRGVPCLIAVHQDPAGDTLDVTLAYASAIGGGRAGIIPTTFKDEAETDLFGEQAVICGGVTALIIAGFETLVEAGYPPELAYFECLHELKLIVDLIQARGITGMRAEISNTAQYGDLTRGPKVIADAARTEMRRVLEEIRTGRFAREWILESQAGGPVYNALTRAGETHQVEELGRKLRAMMPWLENS